MEKIAKLLFATTLLSIFAYLLIFTSLGQSRNGGEYWGFDGYIEPQLAAVDSFEAGEYRFLELHIRVPGVSPEILIPSSINCVVVSTKRIVQTRPTTIEPELGDPSRRTAFDFADAYNRRLLELLYFDSGFDCEHPTD